LSHTAFAGESQARNRYSFAASIARKEGYEQISSLFLQPADDQKQNAKLFFNRLQGGEATITAGYPAGLGGNTLAQQKGYDGMIVCWRMSWIQ
jgi:rubrerythrin